MCFDIRKDKIMSHEYWLHKTSRLMLVTLATDIAATRPRNSILDKFLLFAVRLSLTHYEFQLLNNQCFTFKPRVIPHTTTHMLL